MSTVVKFGYALGSFAARPRSPSRREIFRTNHISLLLQLSNLKSKGNILVRVMKLVSSLCKFRTMNLIVCEGSEQATTSLFACFNGSFTSGNRLLCLKLFFLFQQ